MVVCYGRAWSIDGDTLRARPVAWAGPEGDGIDWDLKATIPASTTIASRSPRAIMAITISRGSPTPIRRKPERRTKFPDLWVPSASLFDPADVRCRTQAGRQLHYITARTAMNRLDDVLGPENWWDEAEWAENSVLYRLTIRLPDGTTVTKIEAGAPAGMADSGDDDKSAISDGLKRAAAKFGVGRYLYGDGVPDYGPATRPRAGAGPGRRAAAGPYRAAPQARPVGGVGQHGAPRA